MPLTPDTTERVNAVLKERGALTMCPFCPNGQFELVTEGLAQGQFDMGALQTQATDWFMFLCSNCGLKIERSPAALGFVDGNEESEAK